MATASADAKYWWESGRVPLRVTPKAPQTSVATVHSDTPIPVDLSECGRQWADAADRIGVLTEELRGLPSGDMREGRLIEQAEKKLNSVYEQVGQLEKVGINDPRFRLVRAQMLLLEGKLCLYVSSRLRLRVGASSASSPFGFLIFNVALRHHDAGGLTLPHPTANPSAPKPDESSLELTENIMRLRAYRFFEKRGCKHGHALEDWLRAEAEVFGKKAAIAEPADIVRGIRAAVA